MCSDSAALRTPGFPPMQGKEVLQGTLQQRKENSEGSFSGYQTDGTEQRQEDGIPSDEEED
jgi:hypothetical protein